MSCKLYSTITDYVMQTGMVHQLYPHCELSTKPNFNQRAVQYKYWLCHASCTVQLQIMSCKPVQYINCTLTVNSVPSWILTSLLYRVQILIMSCKLYSTITDYVMQTGRGHKLEDPLIVKLLFPGNLYLIRSVGYCWFSRVKSVYFCQKFLYV